MNRDEYKQARRLIRDNGRSAYRWIADQGAAEALRDLSDGQDRLAERLQIVEWCRREGHTYNFNNLFLTRPHWSGLKQSTAR